MTHEEVTILRVHKGTRARLRKLAIAKKESYDEIINRLLGDDNGGDDEEELERRKQKLLKKGINKEIVNLLGIMPKTDLKDEKKLIREAIIRKMSK